MPSLGGQSTEEPSAIGHEANLVGQMELSTVPETGHGRRVRPNDRLVCTVELELAPVSPPRRCKLYDGRAGCRQTESDELKRPESFPEEDDRQ